ncbi:MAG: hypothetical protein ABI759_32635 [Candidatus Solibacter sp.]
MRLVIVVGLALTTSWLAIDKEPAKRLGEAAPVFCVVMATPDKENRDIVTSGRSAPKSASRLIALLNTYSARER